MVNIETEKSDIAAPAQNVFSYLSIMNNWQALMPEQVTKWESNEKSCSFVLGGMATIGMRIEEITPSSHLKLVSEGKSPFPFDLQVQITPNGDNSCFVQLIFNGDMNMMMKMMAEKPLGNFFTYLSKKMKGIR
jgi:hypothetical protein